MNVLLSHSFPITCLQRHKVDFVNLAVVLIMSSGFIWGHCLWIEVRRGNILAQKLEVTEVSHLSHFHSKAN